jgi:hypothetical protein
MVTSSKQKQKRLSAINQWSAAVTHRPPATFPPDGTFTKSAKEIYLIMRRPDISPNGLGSAIQMTQFFANRAGVKLPQKQKEQLLKAVRMLQIELAYLRQAEECHLDSQPSPVFPLPPPEKRVGGKYAK